MPSPAYQRSGYQNLIKDLVPSCLVHRFLTDPLTYGDSDITLSLSAGVILAQYFLELSNSRPYSTLL